MQADKGVNFIGVSTAAVVFTGIAVGVALADVILGRAVKKVRGVPGKVGRRLWYGARGHKGKKEEWELDEEDMRI